MDQLQSELDFHVTDFVHQIEQPGTPTELSLHNDDAENGESAPGFSGDAAPVSDPADEAALEEEVVTAVEDTAVLPVDDAGIVPVKRKRGRPRKNPEARAAPLVKKKETENVCFVCFDPTDPNLVSCSRRGCYKAYHPACVNRDEDFFPLQGQMELRLAYVQQLPKSCSLYVLHMHNILLQRMHHC